MMKVEKVMVYKFEEQPGDGTRYTHTIQICDNLAYVTRDIVGNGAGFKVPQYMTLHDVKRTVEAWKKRKPQDPYKDSAEAEGMADYKKENAFTLASAMRCAYKAFQLEGQDGR